MSKTNRKILGDFGEDVCCGYLEYIGSKIIERNFFTKFGELDVIAKSSDKTLLFIEVKTLDLRQNRLKSYAESYPHLNGKVMEYVRQLKEANRIDFMPEDEMSQKKIGNFKRISEWYANKNNTLVNKTGYRLDFAAITLFDDYISLRYYKNIS